jgi:phenylalanyl-tRNA synthetase beta chain
MGVNMPLITIDKQDVLQLLGESVSDEDLAYNISMMGTDLREVTDTIDVEIFPDRPDLLSTEGFVMALEGYLGIKTGFPEFVVNHNGFTGTIDKRVEKVRPFAVCAIVKNVELSDGAVKSLMQVQEKLHITHGRNRKKVAIGVHDLEKIEFPVTYTTKPLDFSFVPLEWYTELTLKEILEKHKKGIEYAHLLEKYSEYPLWIDNTGTVLSMPPIINSEDTKVEPSTTHLFLDVTGYSKKALEQALNILVCSLARRNGDIYAVTVTEKGKKYTYPNLTPQEMELDIEYAKKWLGLNLKYTQVKTLLEKMRYSITDNTVKIPAYRADILHPVDIIEDIAKAYNMDKITPEIPEVSTIGEEDELEVFTRKIAHLMVGFALLEVKNYFLTSKEYFEKTHITDDIVVVENAVTAENNVLRNWLLPQMLYTLQSNKQYEYPQNLFEVGEVIIPDETQPEKTREDMRLTVTICHPAASFTESKEIFKAFMSNIGIQYSISPEDHPAFIPGRCGTISIHNGKAGIIGEVHPDVLVAWELEVPVACFEVSITQLYKAIV